MDHNGRLFTFVGGNAGPWEVVSLRAVTGDGLEPVDRLRIVPGEVPQEKGTGSWSLRGVTSHERYVTRAEKTRLAAAQPELGRPEASAAAFIPIRKSAAWWALTQDERRAIFEETSTHIRIGLDYLPAVARRLHHCRDLAENAPFDFLTWFEFTPGDALAFDELLHRLRETPEWRYVEREVEVRLRKTPEATT
jgi:chlorite dismutase